MPTKSVIYPDLIELSDQLRKIVSTSSHDSHRLTAMLIPGFVSHRLALDPDCQPTLLISTVSGNEVTHAKTAVHLKHLVVEPYTLCRIHGVDGISEENVFTIVKCLHADIDLQNHFLRIASALLGLLGDNPTNEQTTEIIRGLVELFRTLDRPPRKSVQGLWAELFVIVQSNKPITLAEAWHLQPDERYDFTSGQQYLEVKSCSQIVRQHYFSLTQLLPSRDSDVIIASVFVDPSPTGVSIADLISKISSKLKRRPELRMRIEQIVGQSLGQDWRKVKEDRFDLSLATKSLAYFSVDEIPKVNPNLPVGVSEVQFKADLSLITPIEVMQLRHKGGMFTAI